MTIGFLGTGAITTALVTGLCTAQEAASPIWVSPRNQERAVMLARLFSRVRVAASNQQVVDESDTVVLAFLPKDRDAILNSLKFRDDQVVVNLLGATRNGMVAAAINAPCPVVRAVPLPCAAERVGPIVVHPGHDRVSALFAPVGEVIAVAEEEQLETLSVVTSLMAPYFEMLGCITDWAVEKGIERDRGAAYVASMFAALSLVAGKHQGGDFHGLADMSMTPGGLNELARGTIRRSGGFAFFTEALEAVARRVTEKGKG